MKKIIIYIILTLSIILSAAQFKVINDVKEMSGDITAQRYPRNDVNGK